MIELFRNIEIIDISVAFIALIIAIGQARIERAAHRYSRDKQEQDLKIQRIIQIHDWGNDCIDALAEAREFSLLNRSCFASDGDYEISKRNLLYRLSALADQGRLFFRNVCRDKYRLDKFPDRRGWRPEIIDPIVVAYKFVEIMHGTPNEIRTSQLHDWRSRFISLLQYEVDPEWFKDATHYTVGPGGDTGIGVYPDMEPPKWPKDRLPAGMKDDSLEAERS